MRTYVLVKIKNRSHKWSHKHDRIRVGRIRTFQFSFHSVYEAVAYDLVKTRLSKYINVASRRWKVQGETNYNAHSTLSDWFSFSASACKSNNLVSTRY